uniref:Uncharacterized protein n=1 Tax=Caenorhabditis japonica TaxID=281687 RepID=A0A8R1HZM0_CAEJA
MLSRNSSFFRIAKRSHSAADPARGAQTELVLLHAGQPWNEFHAREFLKLRSGSRFRAPNFVHDTIAGSKLLNENVRGCITAYKDLPSLEDQVDKLALRIEKSLETVIPEHGPFRVSRLFQFDAVPFAQKFDEIKGHRSQKYIFLPLYPHFSSVDGGNLLVESAKMIENSSSSMMVGNKEVAASRIEQNSDYSYDVGAVWRWDNHSILADYWASKISEILPEIDAVVFAAPQKFSCHSGPVHATCERTMSQLGDIIPWRLGFYSSWESFDVPSFQSVGVQVQKFRKGTAKFGKIAVVPITDVIDTFDTFYTIPKKFGANSENTIVLRPDQESEKLVHGISEIVKNRLLGRKDRQLEAECSQTQLDALRIFAN